MTWLLLALGAAAVYAVHGAWSKEISGRMGPLLGAWALFTFSFPLFLLYLAVTGIPEVGPRFWPALVVNSLVNTASIYLFLSALRAGDLGITYPLLALTPLFVIPVEWLLLGVLPGSWGVVGIILMVAGIYLLNFGERRAGLLAPLEALARSPGARQALAVALLWSVSGTVDRVAVLESSPAFYGTFASAALSLLFVLLLYRTGGWGAGVHRTGERGVGVPRAGIRMLIVHGALFALMFVLQMEALRLALASYVLSIKRAGSILAVLLGWMAFRESALRHRLLGTAITVLGATVLALFG